jgi:hypothetical protein
MNETTKENVPTYALYEAVDASYSESSNEYPIAWMTHEYDGALAYYNEYLRKHPGRKVQMLKHVFTETENHDDDQLVKTEVVKEAA